MLRLAAAIELYRDRTVAGRRGAGGRGPGGQRSQQGQQQAEQTFHVGLPFRKMLFQASFPYYIPDGWKKSTDFVTKL